MHIYRGKVHEGQPSQYTPKLERWALHRQSQGRRFSQTEFDVFKDTKHVGTCTLVSRGNEPDGVHIPWPADNDDYLHLTYEPTEGASVVDLLTEEQKEGRFQQIVTNLIENPELASERVGMIYPIEGPRS